MRFFRSMPTLRKHICHVVGRRAEKQVVRAHARRVVAAMADCHLVRNRANSELVSDAVGSRSSTESLRAKRGVAANRRQANDQGIAVLPPSVVMATAPSPLEISSSGASFDGTFRLRPKPSNKSLQRVTVGAPPLVVESAPTALTARAVAFRDGTGRLIEHRILQWFGVMGPDVCASRPLNCTSGAG